MHWTPASKSNCTTWDIDVPARVLIIGLDGATFDLIEPWASAGDLPYLRQLMEGGAWGRLWSTTPPATFPAWTSLMTGVNPGQHGVYDFTRRVPGTYRVEFINATFRRRPSVWRLLSAAGRKVGVMGLPATYPPETVNGFFISGFDSPVATNIDRSFMRPPELYDELKQAVGPYQITDIQELRIGPGWHEMALDKLLHAARRRTDIAVYLLARAAWDCVFVHYGESDTVAHHFWAFHDPGSPRFVRNAAPHLRQAIHSIYRTLDRAIGELWAHAGQEATVLVVSDHGSGGTGVGVLHLNRWLAGNGWLRFEPVRAASRLAASLKRLGLGLPAQLQEWVLRGPVRHVAGQLESRTRLRGIDWAGTRAFSEEVNTFPSIWLNVRGRDPAGTVQPGAEYERLRDEILTGLAAWRNPETGAPVVAHGWRREELYHGSAVTDAPDIVLEPALDRGYAYTVLSSAGLPGSPLRTLAINERLGVKGGSMNGSHRPDGVFIMAGKGVEGRTRLGRVTITDIAPTLLHLLQVPVPAGLDGRVLTEVLPYGGKNPSGTALEDVDSLPEPYSTEHARLVSHRLRGLGYQS